MKKISAALCLLFLFFGLANAAYFQAQTYLPTQSGPVNMGGGPNMLERSLFASNTPTLPYSQWYVPGNGSPALSTSDYYLTNGFYWSIPYDLDTMGADGAAIKAREGGNRYVWLICADHIGDFSSGSDVYVAYSNDPQILPDPSTMRSLIPYPSVISVVDQNGYTQNSFFPYQTPHLVYNPDDPTNPFYIYMEGLSTSSARQHELTLIKSADLLTSTVIGPTIPTTSFTGWTSYGKPTRLGVNSWVVWTFGKIDGSFQSPAGYKYTSTDGWTWTPDYSQVTVNPGPFTSFGGNDYTLSLATGTNDYVAWGTVNASKVYIGPNINVSAAFGPQSDYPWQTLLQDVQAYFEDGIATIYAGRGFPVSNHDRTNRGPYMGNVPHIYSVTANVSGTTFSVTAWPAGMPPLQSPFRIGRSDKSYITAQLTGTGGAACPDPTCDGGVGTYSLNINLGTIPTQSFNIYTNGGLWQQMTDLYYYITDPIAAASAAPLGVKASCAAGQATAQWNNSLPHQNYRVYYGSSAGSQPTLAGNVTGTSITFTPPANQQTWIKVVTMNVTEQKSRVVNVYCSAQNAMVNKHVNRVLNDGGSGYDITFIATADQWLSSNNTYRYLNWWTDVRFGYKLNGSGFISRIYDLGTTLLPRGGDYTPTTSNTWPSTSSNTSYSANSFRGTTPSWVNNASSAHGYFGNGRLNNIQRWNEITLLAAYQKPGTASAGFFGTGEFNGYYLAHGSGSSGTVDFAMSPAGVNTYTVASVAFSSATAAHVAAGVFDGSTGTAYLDGVAGTPVDFSAFANPTLTTNQQLLGSFQTNGNPVGGTGTVNDARFLASGSITGVYKTSTGYTMGNAALYTGAGLAVFNKGLSQSLIQSWGALYN